MLMGWLVLSVSGFPGPQCQHDGPFFKQLTFKQLPCSPQPSQQFPTAPVPFPTQMGR